MAERATTAESVRRDNGRRLQLRRASPLRALRDRDPQSLLEELQESVVHLAELPLVLLALLRSERRHGSRDGDELVWAPRMDVLDHGDTTVVRVDVPGVNKDDIQVELEGDSLVIRGQTGAEREKREKDFYRLERYSGSFYRRLPLPYEVDPERIDATLSDGVLEIRIPKPPGQHETARRIPVKHV